MVSSSTAASSRLRGSPQFSPTLFSLLVNSCHGDCGIRLLYLVCLVTMLNFASFVKDLDACSASGNKTGQGKIIADRVVHLEPVQIVWTILFLLIQQV